MSDSKETSGQTVENRHAEENRNYKIDTYLAHRPLQTVTTSQRLAHYLIDLVCFYALVFSAFILIGAVAMTLGKPIDYKNETTEVIIQLITPFLLAVYYCFCESIWQKTPGKFFTKTIVIDEYGGKPSFKQIVLRSISRLVPFEAFSCLGSPNSYGWHDRWSDTFVVPVVELEELKKLLAEPEKKI